MTIDGVLATVCGIRCSLCKRKISRPLPESATQEDFDAIVEEIHRVHMEWHKSRRENGKEKTPSSSSPSSLVSS